MDSLRSKLHYRRAAQDFLRSPNKYMVRSRFATAHEGLRQVGAAIMYPACLWIILTLALKELRTGDVPKNGSISQIVLLYQVAHRGIALFPSRRRARLPHSLAWNNL